MPHPVAVGVAVYTAWQLGYFDSWWDSTKPPTPEELDPETLRDVMAKYSDDGENRPVHPDDLEAKAGFDPCQCCDSDGTEHCCRVCDDMKTNIREMEMINEDWVDKCCTQWNHSECCRIKKEREGRSKEMGPFKPPFDVDRDLMELRKNKYKKTMKSSRLKEAIKKELNKLYERKEQLNELAPLVWAVYGLGTLVGATGGAWMNGYFDSERPPNPSTLPFEVLNKVIQQFGDNELINNWNKNPKLAYDVIQNPKKYERRQPIHGPFKPGSPGFDEPVMNESDGTSLLNLIKWAISNTIIARGTRPNDLNPIQIKKLQRMYNNSGEKGVLPPYGGSPGPTYPEMPDFMGEGRMCEECGKAHEGSCGSMEEGLMACGGDEDCSYPEICFEGFCTVGCKMEDSYDECASKQQGKTMGPYKPFDVDDLRENVNPNFINNMESLYASKGCTGLDKKISFFRTKLAKVNSRSGSQTGNWSDQINEKISHIEEMMSNLGCGSTDPSIA